MATAPRWKEDREIKKTTGVSALICGFSSLLWCQVRWEDKAEPKGMQAFWWKDGWAAGWGQPDEGDGSEEGSLMMLKMRVYV